MNRRFGLLIVPIVVGFTSICNAQFSSNFLDRFRDLERFGAPTDYRKLLGIGAVRKELAITPEQFKKLEQLFENAPSIATARNKSVAMQEFEASLQEVLSPNQWNRCVELRIQNAGSASLVREDVAAKLNLSEEQLADLRKLRDQAISAAFSAGFRLGFRPDTPSPEELKKAAAEKKVRQKESLKKGIEILTKTQRDQFQLLRGKLFAFPDSDE